MDTACDVTAGMRTVAEQELSCFRNPGWILPLWRAPSPLGSQQAREGPGRSVLLLLLRCGSLAAVESPCAWIHKTGGCLRSFCGLSPAGRDPGLHPAWKGFLPIITELWV